MRKLLTAAALSAALATPALAETTKVGFIYIGPVGDFGWTAGHDRARQELQDHFGDAVETSIVENVDYGADAERVMTQMAISGTDVIFAASFGYGPDVNAVAGRFPDVAFQHATGYIQEHPNISLYDARFYEGRAVLGHIAGKMTETNTIGYIASYPIPAVISGINSAFLHARAVNPDVNFRIIWTYSWFDPALEADAAETLIEQGADVIMQHTDSTAAVRVAEDAGVMAFGQASDMTQFGPNAHLSAIVDRWAPYYISRVQAVKDGTWEAQNSWMGFADGIIEMAPWNDRIPAELQAEADNLIAAIAAGEYHPFTGPINRQDGTAWLAEGETAPDADLATMNFYVEGITQELPN
ncbi:MAG: BMP family ABC transporter substrate-binding protein [Roseinatronobacter sp.]